LYPAGHSSGISYINYKCVFEEYVKYFGNIQNKKIKKYLSKLDGKCTCIANAEYCYYNICKYNVHKYTQEYKQEVHFINELFFSETSNDVQEKSSLNKKTVISKKEVTFDTYRYACNHKHKYFEYSLIVKDHKLLKCIIEIIKILHDDNIFDNII
jgi:hypothetical protein